VTSLRVLVDNRYLCRSTGAVAITGGRLMIGLVVLNDTGRREALDHTPYVLAWAPSESPKEYKQVRSRLLFAGRLLVALAIGYFIVASVVHYWPEVRGTFAALSWPMVVLSLLAAFVGIVTNTFAWRAALSDLDHEVPIRAAGQVFLVGQLGKYLPGSVWSYVLQMELGRRFGIPRTRAFLASLTSTGIGITVGLVIGAFGLPKGFGATHTVPARVTLVLALVLLPCALVCAHPRALTWILAKALRALRRPPLERPLTWSGTLRVVYWSAAGYACFGLHLWLLVRAEAGPGVAGLLWCVAAIGLAISLSTFVVVLPSGIGAREFVIAITLVPLGVPYGTGLALALASRLVATVADVAAAGAAAALAAREVRTTEPVAN
jgi:uncharacterized membrane protein YbhN (UPF0104 family)